jgi:hypothetical protein
MNITELGDESFVVAYIVIEVPFLPEVRQGSYPRCLPARLARDFALENLHEAWQQARRRLAYQQVNMLRHHNVSEDIDLEAVSSLFQSSQERVFHVHLREKWQAMVAAECQEVRLSRTMKPFESVWHGFPCSVQNCWNDLTLWIRGLPPFPQKQAERMGHGAFESRSASQTMARAPSVSPLGR